MTHQIRVFGIVQGVGFRPTVARYANLFGIRGTVSNRGPFVEIIALANQDDLEKFEKKITDCPPKRAVILKMEVREIPDQIFSAFTIIESEKTKGEILISPDIAVCRDCKKELYDKKGRRYLHPFINCTCCGPRLTILDGLPYDRVRTSMKEFPMCGPCSDEYHNPDDRRYDAQPVCCNDCGPVVYLLDLGKNQPDFGGKRYKDLSGLPAEAMEEIRAGQKAAITRVRKTIAEGGIAAIKGIGGYHICCDALNQDAVMRLRREKNRPAKPFAVMMKDMQTAKKYVCLGEKEIEVLTGYQKPIILLKKRETSGLATAVAPDNPNVGVMLPYAPIQLLLFDYEDDVLMPDALVMTSANFSGAPIVRDEADALKELSALCDEILAHNRKIRIRADDTVMDFYRDQPYQIRRSRGYAPLPLLTDRLSAQRKAGFRCLLAIGGELKNSFCIRTGNLSYLSPYVGDLEDLRTVRALKETVKRFMDLLEVKPEAVICDLHPRYNSVKTAEELAGELQVPVFHIQHHYAHILSCLAENDEPGPVIGISMDGTGYGEDGSIWGGEILIADTDSYERVACIKPFRQIGGDASSRDGWRIAVSMIYSLCLKRNPTTAKEDTLDLVRQTGLCGENQAKALIQMSELGLNSVKSTSAGRLFDAVSSVLGIRRSSSFEGEASMSLQFAAERAEDILPDSSAANGDRNRHTENKDGSQSVAIEEKDGLYLLSSDRIFEKILYAVVSGKNHKQTDIEVDEVRRFEFSEENRLSDRERENLAYDFHRSLADLFAEACLKIRTEKNINKVALSGGCFQNKLLLKLTEDRLTEEGFTVLRHRLIPPNDGGLALGQAVWTGYEKKLRGSHYEDH